MTAAALALHSDPPLPTPRGPARSIEMVQTDKQALIEGVKDAVQRAFFDIKDWTDAQMNSSAYFSGCLFPELLVLGRKLECDVRTTAAKGQNFEFLYDLVYLATSGFNENNGYFSAEKPLRRAVMVLECEWKPSENEIIYDFSKLLLARADLRCLIFFRNARRQVESVISKASAAIAAFEQGQDSDLYLLVGLHGVERCYALLDGKGQDIV